MDFRSNGCFPSIQPIKLVALAVMSAALLACAPPPARSDATQEDPMQGKQPPQDARAEQDRVAGVVDDIARQVSTDAPGPSAASEPAPLPTGPVLSSEALEAGVVRLIEALTGPEQTQPEVVGPLLGVALAPDSAGTVTGAQGALGAGAYVIAVWPLHKDNPGLHVSIRVEPAEASQCALSFAALSGALTGAGYVGKPMPRALDPSVSFSKTLGANKAFIRLDTDAHDGPRCVGQLSVNLERTDG